MAALAMALGALILGVPHSQESTTPSLAPKANEVPAQQQQQQVQAAQQAVAKLAATQKGAGRGRGAPKLAPKVPAKQPPKQTAKQKKAAAAAAASGQQQAMVQDKQAALFQSNHQKLQSQMTQLQHQCRHAANYLLAQQRANQQQYKQNREQIVFPLPPSLHVGNC